METQTREDTKAMVDSAIKSISHIATLPEITLRVIELVEDASSTAQDLHTVIANDPALCSRILKVVNSAFYGLPRQIGSINRAIVLLGLNAVKNIAIAASLAKLFRGGELCANFSARNLWSHSVATAAGSKLISDELKLNLPDEAFLAGLIHDIGLMVQMQAKRDGLIQVLEKLSFDEHGAPNADMRQHEREIIGADHETFGSALCESWKFPKSFSNVTGHHHEPLQLPDGSRTLACVVYIADRLAAGPGGITDDAGSSVGAFEAGFRGDLMSLAISEQVIDELRIGSEAISRVREALPEVYQDAEATFM